MPELTLERLDLAFARHQLVLLIHAQTLVLLRTLLLVLGLHAFQLEPAPVEDLICEDGDQGGLEYRPAAVFVEVTLSLISGRVRL